MTINKKIFSKKEMPAIGVAILIHPHFVKKRVIEEKTLKTKFFFVQIGFEAKLKSLTCIEALRKEKISVDQSLSRDKLSVQLQIAEKMNIPYVIIMGQKEAMENSVVVRNMQTMSQNTVKTEELPKYLKMIK